MRVAQSRRANYPEQIAPKGQAQRQAAPRRSGAEARYGGTVARKLPKLQRVLDAPALFSVAYGEIASSIYFALGIVALYALGLTPVVLLAAGAVFLVVALAYAEGTAATREIGGAATFVRRASNDLLGFLTGWVLFLDYLIVIALSALTVPHYLGAGLGIEYLRAGQLGHRGRGGGDRPDRGRAARAADGALQLLRRRRPGRPGHAAPARPARLRAPLLRGRAHERGRPRHGADLGRHRLRPAAGLPRVHRARDRRQPRRGGPLAGPRPAAQPLLGHRRRDDGLPRDRGRRPVGVSGGGRPHRARRGVARGAPHGHRGRAVQRDAEPARRDAAGLRRPHRGARHGRRRDDVHLRLRPARPLARRAPHAPARVRAAAPADARGPALDPRGGARRVHPARRRGRAPPERRGRLACEPLQLRGAARLQRRPAGRDLAAAYAARAPPPVSRPLEPAPRLRRDPGADA